MFPETVPPFQSILLLLQNSLSQENTVLSSLEILAFETSSEFIQFLQFLRHQWEFSLTPSPTGSEIFQSRVLSYTQSLCKGDLQLCPCQKHFQNAVVCYIFFTWEKNLQVTDEENHPFQLTVEK